VLVAVSVVGDDRPGIVALVTKVLFEAGCNLEDVSSTILRGHFSMVLIVRGPQGMDHQDVERRLSESGAGMGLVVSVRPVAESSLDVTPPTHMVSVYGADRPGIVYRVAEALAAAGCNVTDLTSRVIGSSSDPVYALMLEVSGGEEVEAQLASLRESLGVDVSMHPIDADIL
jgi:glycine cleavage system transcriptional repressor